MASFVEDLWSSVFTPGPTPTLLVATNATFAALQLVLFLLLIATSSIHFVVLSFLSGALWWSINWFAKEVRQEQARQEEEKRKQEALEQETSGTSKLNTSADANDSETETEVEGLSKTRRRRVNQPETATLSPESASQSNKSSNNAPSQRKTSEGESSGYISTDSEWEKIDSLARSRKRVFNSVFAPIKLTENAPTPLATPALGSSAPGQPFGSAILSKATVSEALEPEAIIWSRAWHSATEFLQFPDRVFDTPTSYLEYAESHQQLKDTTSEAKSALTFLLSSSSRDRVLHQGLKEYDLISWYCNEIRRHFVTNLEVMLCTTLKKGIEDHPLAQTVRCLRLAQQKYFTPFLTHVVPKLNPAERETSFSRLRESFKTIVVHSLPSKRISDLLELTFRETVVDILGISQARNDQANDSESNDMEIDEQYSITYRLWKNISSESARHQIMTEYDDSKMDQSRHSLLSLLHDMNDYGLGGHRAQKVFAQVMNDMMTEFIIVSYKEQWDTPSLVKKHLCLWVENIFARLAVEVLEILQLSISDDSVDDLVEVRLGDVEKWQEIGLARLGALRTSELFDVIVDWDSSRGAIEDLKQYTTHTASRFSLSTAFVGTLTQRLLHPGASTAEILQLYISIIRAFSLLDPKGVLLDRAARPIRKYLRDRDDTVQAIVGGLLADPSDADNADNSETLVELATELTNAHQRNLQNDSGELDWDDMSWMPDPIDAAADYKKSKGADVVGSLISLFDSKEAFVKELQSMLSERLLKKKANFDQELSVLELLKVRFGDGALQACEVMLRDVLDSKRVDAVIRNDQELAGKPLPAWGAAAPAQKSYNIPQLHSKILSRFFWPAIQDQPFDVPEEIKALQQRYSAGFEALKQSRKLSWLNVLGHVTVELDLEDRVFTDEVTTWQATVIYAFQSGPSSDDAPVTKTVTELAETLRMSASLVRSACLFWVSKRILTEIQRDSFRVLEVLPNDGDHEMTTSGDQEAAGPSTTEADAAAAAAAAAAKETANAAAMEKMNLYWQFIVGMLTNQGAMPLQRIIMMLKIAVPGGFPFGNEELREFLAGMVAQGKLEIVSGGSYKIVR
ncbi:anaphase-promoting complex subunit ApcB, putative [Talaromyces marneffei ATCC 18224]|uniref:Anaphase-promoting complex subunit 2 n=1 Tax=Talaromyces marneffei (strain ATCC 18224 / CBS 334.59 / QM 7333) TaxID=441960 RepID=B6Q3P3_TALMQ|nr:anaphase-promoting complex subunit ApcB, putative [Talaromyces marneffei ATCC 18224]